MKKQKTISQLKKDADTVFSRYIRNKYAKDDYVSCVTCGATKPVKEMQAGHYIKRSVLNLRYDERNVFPQCFRCNIKLKGNYPAYALFITRRWGKARLEELDAVSHNIGQWKRHDYEDVIKKYKNA